MARPRIEIDIEEVKKLCMLNCTVEEIGAFFNVNKRTIERRMAESDEFKEAIVQGKALGRISIKRAQFRIMGKDHAGMAMHLGKVTCEQVEYKALPTDSEEAVPVEINFAVRVSKNDIKVTNARA